MGAGTHLKTAMDDRDHFKNGASPKSQMSRGNNMQRTFLIFAVFGVSFASAFAQDVIVTKDSKRIEAKVTEVNEDYIKYKDFDNQDGPVYTLAKNRIATILYQNGKVEVFEEESKKPEPPPGSISAPNPTQDIDCTLKEKTKGRYKGSIFGGIAGWYPWFEENNREGFTKRMIPFEYITMKNPKKNYTYPAEWSNGLYINYEDQLIKFRAGNDWNNEWYTVVPFQCIYSVNINRISSTRTGGYVGNIFVFLNSSQDIGSYSIQIAIYDPKGGLKTLELKMITGWKLTVGDDDANAAIRCAGDIFNELCYIIEHY
jgi:hypothetical protein